MNNEEHAKMAPHVLVAKVVAENTGTRRFAPLLFSFYTDNENRFHFPLEFLNDIKVPDRFKKFGITWTYSDFRWLLAEGEYEIAHWVYETIDAIDNPLAEYSYEAKGLFDFVIEEFSN